MRLPPGATETVVLLGPRWGGGATGAGAPTAHPTLEVAERPLLVYLQAVPATGRCSSSRARARQRETAPMDGTPPDAVVGPRPPDTVS